MAELEDRGEVCVLHLGGDENRFNRGSVDSINAALDEVVAREGNVALVVTGYGKYFSNGLDLDWLQTNEEDFAAFVTDVEALLHRFMLLDMITVGAINGHAFAAGAMLAATFDVTVMSDGRGWWCLPEVDLGLPLSAAMVAALQSHIPAPALAEAALTGRRYTGVEALAAGIVSETAAPEHVLGRAVEALAAGIVSETATPEHVLGRAVDIAAQYTAKNRRVIGIHKALLRASR